MTISAPSVQNVFGAAPIVAINPPPEGQSGTQVTFSFPVGTSNLSQTFQLNSGQGLPLSQVVTLCIDNSQNPCPITVQHGVFSETVTVAAFSFLTVPTFSNKGGYPISIQLTPGSNPSPTVEVYTDIVFLNFARQSASFSANGLAANSPVATAGAMASVALSFTSLNQNIELLNNVEPTYLYEVDMSIGAMSASAAGLCLAGLTFETGEGGFSMNFFAQATGATTIPVNEWRNWAWNPTPLYLPAGTIVQAIATGFSNISVFNAIVNITAMIVNT